MIDRAYLEWTILFLLFGFGIYTLWVIKNEKKNYLKEGREINFKNFILLVPKWWGEVPSESDHVLSFKRLDTRYEWEANFIWNENPSNKEIRELFIDHINDRKILFDTDTSIIYNPSDFKTGPLVQSGNFEMVRLEGTATCDKAERLYYDAFLVRNLQDNKYLYAESKSSVLNGLVEGPYFEEVMKRLNFIK
jgi:hypothetical protein